MEMKHMIQYMQVYEETIEDFGSKWYCEELGEWLQMDREEVFGAYVDACREVGLPMPDEPEMPDDFMVPYHL